MPSLVEYHSGDDSDDASPAIPSVVHQPQFALTLLNSAPVVDLDAKGTLTRYVDPSKGKEVDYNPTVEEMWRPLAGPFRPNKHGLETAQTQGMAQNSVTGWAEKTQIDAFAFEEQYLTFQNYGYAADPSVNAGSAGRIIGDSEAHAQRGGDGVLSGFQRTEWTAEMKAARRKRVKENGDIHNHETFMGPWASFLYEEEKKPEEPTAEQLAMREAQAAKKRKRPREEGEDDDEATRDEKKAEEQKHEEFSTFHGAAEKDALGRTYMHPPPNLPRTIPDKFFSPKKCVHVWNGHSKGVNQILFFPGTAHLLLSASMDETVKIWDVHGTRQCLRTYEGHASSVRTIDFTLDGTRFVSGSYDRWVKNWDTETGQVISRHTSRKVPYCVKVVPIPGKQDQILVAQGDKKIVQWDTRSNHMVQVYNEHLGPVNTITFIDDNRKFVTTSDDKKVYVWEYGIPVVMKHISEPDMHSMPAVALHPSGKFWVGQSQNNQIHVYGASRKFGLFRKKRFMGHLTSGYACGMGFSPDGKLLFSGDAQGRLFIWDWRTMKIFKRLQCHQQVTIGAAWNPLYPSRIATCSWDGSIKYWD